MSRSRFASVRALLSGAAFSSPPEDHEDDDDAGAQGKDGKGPTAEAIDAVVAAEVDKARTAEATRWNTVMTSDAGAANPKAAARMLNTSTMAADDIVATLGDFGTPAAKEDDEATTARAARLERDRLALANDEEADPKTGAAGGGPGARRGEADRTAARETRKQLTARRNKAAAAKGGRQANAPLGA